MRHPRLEPLYLRADEIRVSLTAREAAMFRLDTERRAFDRSAVQKGLLVVGGGLGGLALVIILVFVLLAR
jgi:hypothetical protein